MPNPSFFVCIDESGDQGFRFDACRSSSHWFVLSAIVGINAKEADLSSSLRSMKSSINWNPRKPLHFKKLTEKAKRLAVDVVANHSDSLRAVSVLVYKPFLSSPETFQSENRLYMYSLRLLLERASWICQDSKEKQTKSFGDGTAKVIFSNMNEVSCSRFRDYMAKLYRMAPSTSIDWTSIDPVRFETLSPGKHVGLELADIVASSFYCAGHHCAKSKTAEWATRLKPVMHRSRDGRYRGAGVKFFPKAVEIEIAQIAPWAISTYPR